MVIVDAVQRAVQYDMGVTAIMGMYSYDEYQYQYSSIMSNET